ncbi:E3 SUMO-protein ligase pli1 [Purpureocillium takamizusanense]|uniref:E3 SUMO-protein ligase pli1 n=1 Tax=Purpureocillium takamizusanense TaxID=2060973 RepID=A0A9Q8QBK0_9HYPO|nr:E3 SUMO-protein ligase pli1 [Purpureocillium takamizusanense]UNI16288.1 E3 SUMO-protein ligase pli1 [Purpureocillium takamizusanense]
MASPVPAISKQEVSSLLRQVQGNSLFNRQLSSVCQVNGLKSTGVKADLQARIVDLIQTTVNANDASRFQQVRQSILNASAQRGSPSSKSVTSRVSNASTSAQYHASMPALNASQAFNRGYQNGHSPGSLYGVGASSLAFRSSPFYQIEAQIGTVRACEVMSQHRNTISIPIRLTDHEALRRCLGVTGSKNTPHKVMVFCASDPHGLQDVAFPHQSELRVNKVDIKANLRGLKNKPGSTRPVDITKELHLRSSYVNTVEFTYALTQKKFYLAVYVCKTTSVDELVNIVATRRRIPKMAVVAELTKKAQDPDVVATSQVLSLKCPLSYMRLVTPCRGLACTHIQCFDATSYLQLQEQGPQWLCPICNKSVPFTQLAVDDYAKDILESTPKSLESVTIEPTGQWSIKTAQESDHADGINGASVDDDDLVEISEVSIVGRRFETPKNVTPRVSTPASSGRGSSANGPRGIASTSAKRPAPTIIDLTGDSDDDDDEPIQRPHKRQATSANSSGRDSGSLAFPGPDPVFFRMP